MHLPYLSQFEEASILTVDAFGENSAVPLPKPE